LVGYKADTWGRKPLFLAGFAILPIRAVLYTLSDNSFWLIGVQVLDGVGAGIFGALAPLVIADIMRGTGRYNLAQGAIATVQGIGSRLVQRKIAEGSFFRQPRLAEPLCGARPLPAAHRVRVWSLRRNDRQGPSCQKTAHASADHRFAPTMSPSGPLLVGRAAAIRPQFEDNK
jgi:hypothetical protein